MKTYPGDIDIIDIIPEGNILIQSISWKFNFLHGEFGSC